jgi:hypothetical protein
VHRCTEEYRTARSYGRRYSAGGHLSLFAYTHRREEKSLSFGIQRKNPLKDLHRVVEHPADSTRDCLSRGIARRASNFSIRGRKEKELSFLGGRSYRKV